MKTRKSGERSIAAWMLYGVVGLLIVPPIAFLIYGAFSSASPGRGGSFTLDNIRLVFTSQTGLVAIRNTVTLGLTVSIASVAAGTILAYLVTKTNVPYARAWELLISLPFYLSPLVLTLAVIAALGRPGYASTILNALGLGEGVDIYSMFGIGLVLTVWMTSYAFHFLRGPIASINTELSQAARSLGAGYFKNTVVIQGRLLSPVLFACALMIFALVADTFSVPALLGQQKVPTVASEIYFATTYYPSRPNLAAAYALLLLALTGFALIFYYRANRAANRYVTQGGKASTSEVLQLGRWRWLVAGLLGLYVAIVAGGSIVSLVLASLQRFVRPTQIKGTLSFDNYVKAYNSGAAGAFGRSVLLAICAPIIVLAIGFLIVYVRRFTRVKGRVAAEFLVAATVAVPGLALGIGMLWAYIRIPGALYGSVWILLIAYVARWSNQGVRLMDAGLSSIGPEYDEAARSLGATAMRRFRTIFAPLLSRTTGSGFIVLFILVINELPVTIFLYSAHSTTLSVELFNSLSMAGTTQAAVYAMVLAGLTLLLAPISFALGRRAR